MRREELAMLLEGFLVPSDQWATSGAPEEAVRIATQETKLGCPAGIASHPKHGFVVLQSSGQGPYILWPDNIVEDSGDGT